MQLKLPLPILVKLDELERLVEQYPLKIPTKEAANFLEMDYQCLIRAIDQGKVPFGIGWDNGQYSNRHTHIPTAPFYFWYIGPTIGNRMIV